MKANEIKKWLVKTFGITALSVTTSVSKRPNPWIGARIIPNATDWRAGTMTYDKTFPPEFGNACLKAIYGTESTTAQQNWAGNVASHMISMRANEWAAVIQTWESQK